MALPPFGAPPTPPATATKRGKLKLAGDLAGTADSPSVAKVNGVAVSGTPVAGQGIVATNGTTASWAALPEAVAFAVDGGTPSTDYTGTLKIDFGGPA